VAAPVSPPVATAVSRMGAPRWGMASGRVLEAGTTVPPILAVALTMYAVPGVRFEKDSWVVVLVWFTHLVGCALRHRNTVYEDTAWFVVGGDRRTVTWVELVAVAAATVGAPGVVVRMAGVLAPGTRLPGRRG